MLGDKFVLKFDIKVVLDILSYFIFNLNGIFKLSRYIIRLIIDICLDTRISFDEFISDGNGFVVAYTM